VVSLFVSTLTVMARPIISGRPRYLDEGHAIVPAGPVGCICVHSVAAVFAIG
jgi:hypothetical protein